MIMRSFFSPLIIGVSVLSLSACGHQNPDDVNVNAYGVDKGAGSVGVHTVLQGDTVYKIAQNYQLPMREIITLNNIDAPYRLNTGFRMKLPAPNEHRVGEGDTIGIVARMYEVSPNRLAALNNIETPYRLTVGQTLRLPSKTPPAAVAQNVNFGESVQNARLQPVEWGEVNNAVVKNNDIDMSAVDDVLSTAQKPQQQTGVVGKSVITPDKKPRVQQASVTSRASIPKQTPKMSGNGKFMRPIDGNIISSFGPKDGGLHNDGINIKAVRGTPVRAAENGVVVYTGDDLEGYGNLILVRHENRMMSAYAHLDKTLIKRGAKVTRGQSIGTVGSSGQVDSPQLHFEIRKGTKALNPVKYL